VRYPAVELVYICIHVRPTSATYFEIAHFPLDPAAALGVLLGWTACISQRPSATTGTNAPTRYLHAAPCATQPDRRPGLRFSLPTCEKAPVAEKLRPPSAYRHQSAKGLAEACNGSGCARTSMRCTAQHGLVDDRAGASLIWIAATSVWEENTNFPPNHRIVSSIGNVPVSLAFSRPLGSCGTSHGAVTMPLCISKGVQLKRDAAFVVNFSDRVHPGSGLHPPT